MDLKSSARARFADFLGGRLFPQYAGEHGSLACNDSRLWRKHFPFSYERAHALLARDLGERVRIECTFYTDQKKVLTPSRRWPNSDDIVQAAKISIKGAGFTSDFYLNLTDGFCLTGATEVEPLFQGRGLGTHVMRNQIEFIYVAGSFKSLHMTAAMSAGGYTWSKFGIEPSDLGTDKAFQTLVEQRYHAVRPCLTDIETSELDPLIRLSCREDVWALSQSSIELGPRLVSIFTGAHAEKSLRRSFTEGVYDRIRTRAQEGLPVPAGQYHLAGTHWRGHVNLSDRAQLRRIAAYAGGFQAIAPD